MRVESTSRQRYVRRPARMSVDLLYLSIVVGISVAGFLSFSTLNTCSASDADLRERFLAEAPTKWAEFKLFSRRLQGTLEFSRRDDPADGAIVVQHRDSFKQGRGGWLSIVRNVDDRKAETVVAINHAYAFQLKRYDGAGPWVMTTLDQSVVDGKSPMLGVQLDMDDRLTGIGLVVYNLWLPELVQLPQFKLKNVSKVTRNAVELARVEYDYEPLEPGNHPARGGWVLLDPDHDWVLREFEVAGEWPDGKGTLSGKYDYNFESFEHPVITHYERRQVASPSGNPPFQSDILLTIDFDFNWRDDVPDSEFTLSAFGLPEAGGRSGVSWIIWINVVAVACITVAAIIRRFARQRSVPPPATR